MHADFSLSLSWIKAGRGADRHTSRMLRNIAAIQVLHDWWLAKRGNRTMPSRAELDPTELKSILPHLLLIDVRPRADGQGHVFTCRLAGTEIDNRFGVNLTGLTLEQAPFGEARALIQQQYETAIREARPVCCGHNVVVGDRYVEYDRLVVPLSGTESGPVTALAVAIDFRCAYLVEHGRPPICERPCQCDQIDLCLIRQPH
jgi:hypothetical protein